MNEFVQHIPGFIDTGEEPLRFDFETVEQLLAHPWIAEFRDDSTTGHRFYRFSRSGRKLMVEGDGGEWWWVLGYLKHPELVDLPVWAWQPSR